MPASLLQAIPIYDCLDCCCAVKRAADRRRLALLLTCSRPLAACVRVSYYLL